MRRQRLSIALASIFCATAAFPQQVAPPPLGATPGPTAAGAPSVPQVSVEAGQADGIAQIAAMLGGHWTLKLSTPVKEGTKSTEFASLDGLASTLNLAVGWSRQISGPSPTAVDRSRKALCAAMGVPEANCDEADDITAFLEAHGMEVGPRLERRFALQGFEGIWLAYFEGKVGTKKHEFFTATGEEDKERPTAWSGTVSFVRDGGSNRFLVGFSRERAFEDSETEVQHCKPVEGSALPTCKDLPLGAPAESKATLGRLSWTYLFASRPMGVSPTATYSFSKSETGLELPVFFLPDSEGRLVGGVRLAWTSTDRDLKATVFIAKPISLFK
jgi:hypothetical protein